jgi:nucleoside-diphosphate-sugar epimerase
MAPDAAKALQKVSLVGQHKSAVIVGGTLGIGAAIARHLAKLGCGRIVIFGRNEARGAAVLEELRLLSPKVTPAITLEFVKGDLSCVLLLLCVGENEKLIVHVGVLVIVTVCVRPRTRCRKRVGREELIIWCVATPPAPGMRRIR